MTVLSGDGEKNGRDGRSRGGLTGTTVGRQSAWVLRRRGRCAGAEEGAGTAWEERRCAALTECGCAEPVRAGEGRTRRSGVWRAAGGRCAAGFGRRWRERRRD